MFQIRHYFEILLKTILFKFNLYQEFSILLCRIFHLLFCTKLSFFIHFLKKQIHLFSLYNIFNPLFHPSNDFLSIYQIKDICSLFMLFWIYRLMLYIFYHKLFESLLLIHLRQFMKINLVILYKNGVFFL